MVFYRENPFTYSPKISKALFEKRSIGFFCTFAASFGPVVQLNRTSDSGSESRGFESRRGHQKTRSTMMGRFFLRAVIPENVFW